MSRIISVKMEPELRHVLAHMYYAIDALINGHKRVAEMELLSIEGLIFWDGDDSDIESYLEEFDKWRQRKTARARRTARTKREARKTVKGKRSRVRVP